jgi:hypothetical protein
MADFIKVHRDDSRKKTVGVKGIESVSNIKVIRDDDSSSLSELSSEPESSYSEPKPRKTKKVLRKKETVHDFNAFSNPKKVRAYQEDELSEDSSEYASTDGSFSENGSDENENGNFEERQKLKQELLIKIQALEKKGIEFSKKFNMTSSYDEMLFEYNKIKHYIESQAAIKFSRRCLMACVTGLEFLNKKFDPFSIKLEGWSENVMESIDDYDNIFEKLHEKYASRAEIAPEIELLLTLGGSAFMFHLTNSLFKSPSIGGTSPIAQNNPNFLANMMSAMSQGMKEAAKPPNFQQQPPSFVPGKMPSPMETRGIRKEMRGPQMDFNLFNGTPLANNYPVPPGPAQFNMRQQQDRYFEEDPIEEDDRFSVASSDSSLSSISIGSSKKISTKKKGKNGGLELNIL